MQDSKNNYLRFVGLRLRDYKIFGGVNDFRFNRHRTIIAGNGGTGKTIIAEALTYLGPSRGRWGKPWVAYAAKGPGVPFTAVVTQGNCDLLNKYRDLIFLNDESIQGWALSNEEFPLRAQVTDSIWKAARRKARTIFREIVYRKSWKIDLHRDLNAHLMAGGERICFGYAFVFALRETLKLDIPIILDSPYGMLDEWLRKGLRDFLNAQPCQQILLGFEHELEEESPDYVLIYVENGTSAVRL